MINLQIIILTTNSPLYSMISHDTMVTPSKVVSGVVGGSSSYRCSCVGNN